MGNDELLELIESLKGMMLDQATGAARGQWEYAQAREAVMGSDEIRPLLPRWIRIHATLTSFEQFMKSEYPRNYQGRREAIKSAFEPILAKLKGSYAVPIDGIVADAIDLLSVDHIQSTWHRALARIQTEPDAAITSARTLLESICKSILEQAGFDEEDYTKLSLQELFVRTWKELDNNQPQKSLDQIKSKLNELIAVFGTLRNQYGDAHGRGLNFSPPTQLEAEFAVNLAGTIALLLVRRWQK